MGPSLTIKEFDNFKQIIDYARDRIYCSGECNGKFNEEIENNVINVVEKHLSTHDPLQDLDKEGNSPLHLIAKYGLYELFLVLKKHPSFDKLKYTTNKKNETALDLVKLGGNDINIVINTDNYINNIAIMVTSTYYDNSFPKIEKELEELDCPSNFSLKELYLSTIKQNIEQILDEKNIEKLAKERVEMQSLFGKIKEENQEEQIDIIKQENKSVIEYFQKVVPMIESLTSEEIKKYVVNVKDELNSIFYPV